MDEAISDFEKCIALDPKNANAYYFRGLSFATKANRLFTERTDSSREALENFDRALADYSKALLITA